MKKLLATVLFFVITPTLSFGQNKLDTVPEDDTYSYNVTADPEAVSASMLQIIEKLPFILVSAEGQIAISGLTGIKISIDGIPQVLPQAVIADYLSSLPASSVEKVEVQTSRKITDQTWGEGGVINIITRRQTTDGVTVQVTGQAATSTQAGGNVQVGANYQKFFFNGIYNFRHRNYAETLSEAEDMLWGKSKTKHDKSSNAFLNTGFHLTDKDRIGASLNLFGHSDRSNSFSKSIPENTERLLQNGSNKRRNYNLAAYYNHQFSRGGVVDVRYEYGHLKYDSDSESSMLYEPISSEPFYLEGNYLTKIREHSFRADISLPIGHISKIAAGVRYAFRDDNYWGENSIYYPIPESSLIEPSFKDWEKRTEFDRNFHFDRWTGYAQYAFKLSDFNFAFGLNWERPYSIVAEVDGSSVLHPFLETSWKINSQNRISFAYAMQQTALEPSGTNVSDEQITLKRLSKLNLNYLYNSGKLQLMGDASFYESPDSYVVTGNLLSDETPMIAHENAYYRQFGFVVSARYMPSDFIHLNAAATFVNQYFTFRGGSTLFKDSYQQISAGADFVLPGKYKLAVNGGYYFPMEVGSTKITNNYYYRLNLSKAFMQDHLCVALFATDFLGAKRVETTLGSTLNKYRMPTNEFGVSLSYRFRTN